MAWEHLDKVETVQRMQDYIRGHAAEIPFSWDGFYTAACYSKRHADRLFKELTGETPRDYVKKVALSQSAVELAAENSSILEAALSSGFDSHEGYTRAFTRFFGVAPSEYRREGMPIPLFVQYPVRDYYSHYANTEEIEMEKARICTVTTRERPARKLLIQRSQKAADYWTYCEEMGCDWEGLFNSIPQKFDTAAILELPETLRKEGFSKIAAGVEVPADYSARIPENCEIAELPACTMIYFQSEPFEREEEFCEALECTFRAVEQYDPQRYGYDWAPELAPSFNFGASAEEGAKLAYPVAKR